MTFITDYELIRLLKI